MILLRNRVEQMLLYICQRHPWLLSAHRRRRAAGGVIQSEPEGLRPRNTGVSGQEKTGVLTQAKRACPLFLCLFAPLGPSIVESDLLYSCLLIQMLIFSKTYQDMMWFLKIFIYVFTYDCTAEVTNRFKGLNLVDREPEELWTEVCRVVQEEVTKTIPKKKKCKKAK